MNDSPEQAAKQGSLEPAGAKTVSKVPSAKTKAKVTAKPVKAPATGDAKKAKPATETKIQAATESPVAAKTKTARSRSVAKPLKSIPPTTARVTKTVATVAKPESDNDAKEEKEKKHAGKKAKLIRDSFTFPEADYLRIGILKQRALKAGHDCKKSELLRAGLMLLSDLSDAALLQVLSGIVKLKPGRPIK